MASKNGQGTVTITAPVGGCDDGYARDRVEVVSLTHEQATALKRLTSSLRGKNARCRRRDARTPDGKVVDNEADAIRWLLDQLAAASHKKAPDA
jgi:hypothetical protein